MLHHWMVSCCTPAADMPQVLLLLIWAALQQVPLEAAQKLCQVSAAMLSAGAGKLLHGATCSSSSSTNKD